MNTNKDQPKRFIFANFVNIISFRTDLASMYTSETIRYKITSIYRFHIQRLALKDFTLFHRTKHYILTLKRIIVEL